MDKEKIEGYVTDAKLAVAVVKTFWEDAKVKVDAGMQYMLNTGVPRTVWFVLGLIAIAAFLLTSTAGNAATGTAADQAARVERALLLMPEQRPLADLLQEAVVRGGYAKKCEAHPHGCGVKPVIVLTSMADGLLGQFGLADPQHLYVSDQIPPGTVIWNAIIVHEFTHFLQWWFGEFVPSDTCSDGVALEMQAHTVGNSYLLERGVDWQSNKERVGINMSAACEMGYDQ